jgi:uncharacterized sulfatase
VRSARYKYIRNLTPEVDFVFPQPRSGVFRSWLRAADAGVADAADKVRRFVRRPAEELYDLERDPFEWHDLAGDPALADVKAELARELERWMSAQGDRGQATELEALEHSTRVHAEEDGVDDEGEER